MLRVNGLAYIPLTTLVIESVPCQFSKPLCYGTLFFGGGSVAQLVRALAWHARRLGASSIRGLWVRVPLGDRTYQHESDFIMFWG